MDIFEKTKKVTVSEAVELLELGFAIATKHMLQDKAFIYKQIKTKCDKSIIEKMTSLPNQVKYILLERDKDIMYRDQYSFVSCDNVMDSCSLDDIIKSGDDLFVIDYEKYDNSKNVELIEGILHKNGVSKM